MLAVRKINVSGVVLALMLMFGYVQTVYGASPTAQLYAIASTNNYVINKNAPSPAKQKRRGTTKLYKLKPRDSIKADVEISLPADI